MSILRKGILTAALVASTSTFAFGAKVIPNKDLVYLGAFRVPHTGSGSGKWWGLAQDGLTYNPNGNGGQGSLFGVGPDNNAYSYVSEITIPTPVISKNVNDLPSASYLQNGAWGEISGGLVGIQSTDVRQKVYGLTYLQKQGTQTSDKLYWASIYNYQPQNTGIDATTIGYSELNLASPNAKGKWTLKNGDNGPNIPSAYTTKWLLTIPKAWADTYVGGQYLGIGRDAVGQTGQNAGYGASLYTFAPATSDNPPAAGTALPATELLRFPSTDPIERNHAVSDWAGGAAWTTIGSKAALIFSYTKAMRTAPAQAPNLGQGDYPWEDYKYPSCLGGGHFCWPETISSTYQLAPPDVFGAPYIAQLKFVDPDDLALVARGMKQPWEVKPYANYQIEKYVFRPQGAVKTATKILGGMTYDAAKQKIYIEEINADGVYPVIHVFQLQEGSDTVLPSGSPNVPSNVTTNGGVVTWGPSVDAQGSSSDIVYVIFKWFPAYTSPDTNHASYPAMWRPVASTTATTWTDPAYTVGDKYNVTAYDAYMQPSNILNVTDASVAVMPSPSITDTTPPSVSSFSLPATATSLTVPVTVAATDTNGVTGYLITETAAPLPSQSASGWSATPPTTYTFSGSGTRTAYAWAKDAAGNLSNAIGKTVTITLPDTTAPALTGFTMPSAATALSVPVSSLTATDNVAVTGYFVSESAAAPAATAAGWTSSAPTSYTFSGFGARTAYAWAKDAAGNISARLQATVAISDATAPTVSSFTMPDTATTPNVPISALTATDNVGVTGYQVTESATAPLATGAGWIASAPTSFTFAGYGARTAYAWAKDAAGNISTAAQKSVNITDATAPTLSSFTMPASATTLQVPVSAVAAADNVAVTGYLISESPSAPAANDPAWSAGKPTGFTFAGYGARTAYAWAKDAAGNVSASMKAAVNITDATAPTMSSFTMPASATTLQVPVSAVAANDNVAVTGYLISESATAPAANDPAWSAGKPTSFTFAGYGSRTAYAWAKDAAGNVSASMRAAVNVTDGTAPTVNSFTLPVITKSLTVPVNDLSATDNVAVIGYLITESATAPAANDAGWSASAPTTFTFAASGARTAYSWAKDAAGNVSAASLAQVMVDTTAPVVSLSVNGNATITVNASATDDVSVAGMELYLDNALQMQTAASSFTSTLRLSKGTHTILVKAVDTAGNPSVWTLTATR